MEYSIRELSQMAGVSARTLRYYDEIGLLKPLYVTEAGYRYYGEKEVDILQQILFYRERKFDLKSIKKMLCEDDFDRMRALEERTDIAYSKVFFKTSSFITSQNWKNSVTVWKC